MCFDGKNNTMFLRICYFQFFMICRFENPSSGNQATIYRRCEVNDLRAKLKISPELNPGVVLTRKRFQDYYFECFYIKKLKISICQQDILGQYWNARWRTTKRNDDLFPFGFFLGVAFRVLPAETRLTVYRWCQVFNVTCSNSKRHCASWKAIQAWVWKTNS